MWQVLRDVCSRCSVLRGLALKEEDEQAAEVWREMQGEAACDKPRERHRLLREGQERRKAAKVADWAEWQTRQDEEQNRLAKEAKAQAQSDGATRENAATDEQQ